MLVLKAKVPIEVTDKIEIDFNKNREIPYASIKTNLLLSENSHYIFNKDSLANEIYILYETNDFLIINKGYKILSHFASTKIKIPNIVESLLKEGFQIKGGEKNRQGIVHRLDEDTKGLMLLTKNLQAYSFFKTAFKKKEIIRYYIALVEGKFEYKKVLIQGNIVKKYIKVKMEVSSIGKKASTYVELISVFSSNGKHYSLLACRLNTGRTHQIRVHLSTLGYPIVNDEKYGKKYTNHSICLHSSLLNFLYKKKQYIFISIPSFKNVFTSLNIFTWSKIQKQILIFLKKI